MLQFPIDFAMKFISHCVNCKSTRLINFPAFISPSLIELMKIKKPDKIRLMYCLDCDFAFFNPRPSEKELLLFYRHYRGAEYQKIRQKYEKVYTKKYNRSLGNNTIEIGNRNANFTKIINNYIKAEKITKILDFGGDRGQFIPPVFNHISEKYVYEVSAIKPVKGVKKITRLNDLYKLPKFDLIICSHVLEHVVQPSKVLHQLKKLAHENTYFYLELPIEIPINYFSNKLIKRFLLPGITKCLNLKPLQRFTNKYPFAFCMHEHLNKFSSLSLKYLLAIEGFTIEMIYLQQMDFGWVNLDIISCLAKIS